MVPDDGFLYFYTSAFLFQLLTISYLKKKRQTNSKNLKKKKKTDQTFCSGTLLNSSLTIP